MLKFKNNIETPEHRVRSPKRADTSLEDIKIKLPPIDSQQLVFILDEIIKKLKVISILPFLIENCRKYGNIMGRELLEHLERHKVEIETFSELKSTEENHKTSTDSFMETKKTQTNNINKGLFERSPSEENMSDVNLIDLNRRQSQLAIIHNNKEFIINNMKSSISFILGLLTKNQLAQKTIMSDAKIIPISSNMEKCIDVIKQVKIVFVNKMSASEDTRLNRKEQNLLAEQKDISSEILNLENEISRMEKEMQEMTAMENEKNCKLTGTLESMKIKHEECLKKIKLESQKQELTYTKNQDSKTKKLNRELETVSSKYEAAVQAHFSEEAQLRKKKYKVEAEFEDAAEAFYKEMVAKQVGIKNEFVYTRHAEHRFIFFSFPNQFVTKQEIDDTHRLYSREKNLLEMTEHKLAALKTEYDRIMEEREEKRKKQLVEQQQFEKLVRAVTIIQSMWRSYKVNKAIKMRRKKSMAGHSERRKSVKKF